MTPIERMARYLNRGRLEQAFRSLKLYLADIDPSLFKDILKLEAKYLKHLRKSQAHREEGGRDWREGVVLEMKDIVAKAQKKEHTKASEATKKRADRSPPKRTRSRRLPMSPTRTKPKRGGDKSDIEVPREKHGIDDEYEMEKSSGGIDFMEGEEVPKKTRTRGGRGGREDPGDRGGRKTGLDQDKQKKQDRSFRTANIVIRTEVDPAKEFSNTCLAINRDYFLEINIGYPREESLVEERTNFPDKNLPKERSGNRIEVIVTSSDLDVDSQSHFLTLPRRGESFVCDCPAGEDHQCRRQDRKPFLIVPFKTRKDLGILGEMDVRFLYKNNLLQHYTIEVFVDDIETEIPENNLADLKYTLDESLEHFKDLEEVDTNIFTDHQELNGKLYHRIAIKNKDTKPLSFRFSEDQMINAMKMLRKAFYDIHIEATDDGRVNLLDDENRKSIKEFKKDLMWLIDPAKHLYHMLYKDQDPDDVKEFKRFLQSPQSIQIARSRYSELTFPWAMIYDIPMDSNTDDYHFCRLVEEWGQHADLITPATHECPFQHEHRALNTICPFGFWGFRHSLEQPPSAPKNGKLQKVIHAEKGGPRITAGIATNLNKDISDQHIDNIGPDVKVYSKVELRDALKNPLEILYFYVHGGRQNLPGDITPLPILELGDKDYLEPTDISVWHETVWTYNNWQEDGPLVFINGCHTAEISPDQLISFVDTFTRANASGVIGTEITVHQNLAGEVAETFLGNFKNQMNVSDALHDVRIRLLKKGNLLGLVYTPYCLGELRLIKDSKK